MQYIKAAYPEQRIVFVFQTPNVKITKTSLTTYKMWAESKGFEVMTPTEMADFCEAAK